MVSRERLLDRKDRFGFVEAIDDGAPDRLDLFPGDRATLSFPPSAVTLYPL